MESLKYKLISFSDLVKITCPDKVIVRIGLKNHNNEKRRTNHNEPFSLKQILEQDRTSDLDLVTNERLQFELHTVSSKNENLKSTKLVLQANDKTVNGFLSNTSQNNPSNNLEPFQVVGSKEKRFEENIEKERTEINSRTFLENVVAKPIESFINKSPSLNDSSLTNNLRASSSIVHKSNSFPCSSKMITSSFPSYRKSYLIAIGAENEIHKNANTKTYPRKKDRSDMNVKLLELNKELPPRSPSKQFLSISFDNILDGRLLKNNDLTEPSPLIVPLNQSESFLEDGSVQSSHFIEKKWTEKSSAGHDNRGSRNNIKRLRSSKCPPAFHTVEKQNGISCSSDTSTESSLTFESHRHRENPLINTDKAKSQNRFSDDHIKFNHYVGQSINKNSGENKKETIQNDLIPSVLSDLDNLSKSIDEEIFDIPNKVKRRLSILDDDIYCLETNEKDVNVKRRHKHCYKCNYDKDNVNIENESKYTKKVTNSIGKSRINLLKLKSDEEYRKSSIKDISHKKANTEGLTNKINCKKKDNMKKIKSIEDLKINKLIDTINKNVSGSTQYPTNKKKMDDSFVSEKPPSYSKYSTTELLQTHDNYLKSVEQKLQLVDETLSNELERLTNEFKKNISTTNQLNNYKNSILNKVLSENEIYDLMHSEKLNGYKECNSNSVKINSELSGMQFQNISDVMKFDDTISQTRCDNFRHDFHNSKFKLINTKTSKIICDIPAHKKDSLRSKLLRNNKPSIFSLTTDDGELSDDSLKADEEVRNLLRQTEESNNTEVQQWNGVTSSHSITTDQSITTITSNQTNNQISTATTNNIKGGVLNSVIMLFIRLL